MKASDIFTPEEIAHIKFILKLFNGKVVSVGKQEKVVLKIIRSKNGRT